jgi:hypothetical protein
VRLEEGTGKEDAEREERCEVCGLQGNEALMCIMV